MTMSFGELHELRAKAEVLWVVLMGSFVNQLRL